MDQMAKITSRLNETRGSPQLEGSFVSPNPNLNGDTHDDSPSIHPTDLKREEEYILLTLAPGEELYGLQISTKIKEASNGQKRISTARLYSYLSNLEDSCLVSSRWENSNDPRRRGAPCKYYSITSAGAALIKRAEEFRNDLRLRILR